MNKNDLHTPRMYNQGPQYGLNHLYGLKQLADDCWTKDSYIAEIGSYDGVSTGLLAELCGHVLSVDIACRPALQAQVDRHANVTHHTADSKHIADLVDDNSLDGVYIDGDHSYGGVMRDVRAWWPVVKDGGFIAGHDYIADNMRGLPEPPISDGVRRAVDELMCGHRIKFYSDTSWAVRKERPLLARNYCLVTMAVGSEAQKLLKVTGPRMESYAASIGASYYVIDANKVAWGGDSVMFNKFQIGNLLSKYDRIMYVDADVVISPDCPNMFDIVPPAEVGAFLESDYMDHTDTIRKAQQALGSIGWDRTYFNAGVIVVSGWHRDMFNSPAIPYVKYGDQTQLNYNVQSCGFKIHPLPGTFNYQFRNKRMTDGYASRDNLTPIDRRMAKILHYSDFPKGDERVSEIENDMVWGSGSQPAKKGITVL